MATKKRSCKGSLRRLKVVEKKCVSKSNKFNKTATQKQLTNLLNRLKKMTKSKSKGSKGSKRKNCPKGSRRVGRICRSTADLNFLKVQIEQGMSPKDARAALKEAKMKAVAAAMGAGAPAAPAAKKSAGAAPAAKKSAGGAPAKKSAGALQTPEARAAAKAANQQYHAFMKACKAKGMTPEQCRESWKSSKPAAKKSPAKKPAAKTPKFGLSMLQLLRKKPTTEATAMTEPLLLENL